MDLQALGMTAIHDFDDVRQSPLPRERLKAAHRPSRSLSIIRCTSA
jgi:hypothetical protein